MAARLQALSRRPLAAAERYYRLRLDKVAAAAAADHRQIRRCLRQRMPMGLCVLDFCCLETRKRMFLPLKSFELLISCSIEYFFLIFIKTLTSLAESGACFSAVGAAG